MAVWIPLSGCSSTPTLSRPAGVTDRDKDLATIVQGRLRFDPVVDGLNIGVQIDNGVATLSGTIPDQSHRARAVSIAEGTTGVTEVVDKMVLWETEGDPPGRIVY
jgi:osmotically-inducible protein OsmY